MYSEISGIYINTCFVEHKKLSSVTKYIFWQFLVDVIMQLVDSAKLDMSATAYANDVKKGIYQFLKSQNADSLAKNLGKSQPVQDLQVRNVILASFI